MNKNLTNFVAALMVACCCLVLSTQSSFAFTEKMNANPVAPLQVNAVATSPTCYGSSNGSIDATVAGGTLPYSYIWSNGATTQDIFNLVAGSYTVTVTDGAGVVKTKSLNVISAVIIQGYTNCTKVCYGSCNGMIDLTIMNGTGPFTYHWSNGASTEDLVNVCAGVYSVTVYDANGCSKLIATQIQSYTQIVLSATKTDLNCSGVCIGAIDLTVTGGTAPYTYAWSNGGTTQDLSGLCAGPYNVTVTDFNGCSKVKTVNILQPVALGLSLAPNAILCNGTCSGIIHATVTGGTAPYYYNWSNGASIADLYDLCAGDYSLTVTDAKGCVKIASTTISQPAAPLAAEVSVTDVNCNTVCGGAINITASGGTAPYSYLWTNGVTTEDRSGLCQGYYCVTITDANMCSIIKCANVNQTIPPTISLTGTNLMCNSVCSGAVDLNVVSENAPFTYNWSNGATTEDISGVCAGTYCVTVYDANGCSAADCITIAQPSPIILTPSHTDNSCYGFCFGTASVSADGGNAPYSYAWENGSTENAINGLCNGNYCVTVYDAHQCSASICILISSPSTLNAEANATNNSCYNACNGTANVSVNGGTAPYSYSWSNGNTNANISALCVGNYCVTVYDAHQCSIVKCVSVTEPSVLGATANSSNNSCFNACNGTANVSANGGTAPYSYIWSNGNTNASISALCAGDYCVTVYDAHQCSIVKCVSVTEPSVLGANANSTNNSCFNACNGTASVSANGGTAPYSYIWSNGNTNSSISALCTGDYCVTVYDAHQCSVVKCVSVTQPDVLDATANSSNVGCFNACNGTANVSANGGTAPYSYIWSNGNTNASISALCAGDYCVTVYDAHQCSVVKCVNISQPAHLQSYINCSQLNCHGDCNGIADLSEVGGTAPFTFHWSNGATTEDLSGLCAGLYCVTVTDANNCTSIACSNVTEPTALTATAYSTNVNCFNNCNGTASVSANGGTTPYTYNWSNGNTNASMSALCAGDYCVTVYDAHQCSIVKCVSITQPDQLAGVTSQTNNNCFQSCNGTASVSVTGGTAPYSYAWSNGNSNPAMSGLCAGPYCVTVTDAHQCTIVKCVTISEPTSLSAIIVGADATNGIYPNCNGSANLTVSGGTAPYTYLWSNGATSEDLSGLCPGTYSVTVMDAHQCPKVAVVTIYLNHTCNIGITGYILNIGCNANCNGSINITVSNATSPTYQWSNGATTEDVSGLCAGTYSVTVTDAYLCTASQSYTVNQNAAIVVTITSVNNTNCSGGCCNGTATASATGGVAPYTYHWSTGSNNAAITALCAGTYTVTVTDAAGCTKTGSVCITCVQPCVLTLSGVVTNVSCNGGNNGAINFTVTGGSAYTYHWNTNATTEDISGLAAGTYSVTVTSAGGCSGVKSFTVCQPTAICASVVGYNTCYGVCAGSADLTVAGGTAPYTYHWSNNAATQDISGLCAGTYSVTVYDANQCSVVKSICITQNSQIVVTITSTNNTNCNGGCCNGTASASASGGTAPYTYHWSTGANCANITGLCAGTYTVTVTDAAGCTKTGSVCITCVPPCNLTVTAVVTNVSCNGGSNGAIDVSVSGGSGYAYHWNNNATTQDRTGLCAGTYTVTVTASGGCSAVKSYTVCQPTALCGSICATNTCNGQCNGAADLTVSGGTAPYSYHWNSGATTQDRTCLCVGTYYVTITDANGCSLIKSVCIYSVSCGCGWKNEDEPTTLTSSSNTELNMHIYPNPLTAQTTFEFVASQDVTGALEIYSVTGSLIAKIYQGDLKAGVKYNFSYNADELAAGMYLARLATNNGTIVQNIVKIQ